MQYEIVKMVFKIKKNRS